MDEWKIERRVTVLPWKPRLREVDIGVPGDVFGGVDEPGALVAIPLLILAALLLIVLVPFVVFVLELALLLALIIPLVVLALVVGLRRHDLVATNTRTRERIVAPVRGIVGSMRLKRTWREEIAAAGRPHMAGAPPENDERPAVAERSSSAPTRNRT